MNYYLLLYYNYYELQCSTNNSNARSELYRFFICIICIYVLFQLTVSFACKTHQSRNYCHFAKCCVFSTHAQAAGPNRLLSQCVEWFDSFRFSLVFVLRLLDNCGLNGVTDWCLQQQMMTKYVLSNFLAFAVLYATRPSNTFTDTHTDNDYYTTIKNGRQANNSVKLETIRQTINRTVFLSILFVDFQFDVKRKNPTQNSANLLPNRIWLNRQLNAHAHRKTENDSLTSSLTFFFCFSSSLLCVAFSCLGCQFSSRLPLRCGRSCSFALRGCGSNSVRSMRCVCFAKSRRWCFNFMYSLFASVKWGESALTGVWMPCFQMEIACVCVCVLCTSHLYIYSILVHARYFT